MKDAIAVEKAFLCVELRKANTFREILAEDIIHLRLKRFERIGCLRESIRSWKLSEFEEKKNTKKLDHVCASYQKRTDQELQILHKIVWKILYKLLKIVSFKLQQLQSLEDWDNTTHRDFCRDNGWAL